uniref:Uncharacterized protein n=1 Tax=Micromonospora carbonacea TaxID=47853 RepID=A0A7D5Y8F1_9ACTN|nr:hypothetical protein HZU44_01180 [Micromonospora carbonacea]
MCEHPPSTPLGDGSRRRGAGTVLAEGFLTEEQADRDAGLHYARHYGTVVIYPSPRCWRSDRRASSPAP